VHELGLAENIIRIAVDQIERHGARRATAIKLRVGDAVAVDPEALSFGFEVMTETVPELRHARLEFERVPHRGRCRDCSAEFEIVEFAAWCPACGGMAVDVISGNEFEVLEMDIEQD
jgi:hydrogenase nickel incorporation protein HypA/HybF